MEWPDYWPDYSDTLNNSREWNMKLLWTKSSRGLWNICDLYTAENQIKLSNMAADIGWKRFLYQERFLQTFRERFYSDHEIDTESDSANNGATTSGQIDSVFPHWISQHQKYFPKCDWKYELFKAAKKNVKSTLYFLIEFKMLLKRNKMTKPISQSRFRSC